MPEPTNDDIIHKFEEHAQADAVFQDESRLMQAHNAAALAENEGKLADLASKIDGLATKEDLDKQTESIKEAVLLSNRIKVGEAGLKYLIEKAPNLAALGMILLCIWLFIKFGLLGAIASVTSIKL